MLTDNSQFNPTTENNFNLANKEFTWYIEVEQISNGHKLNILLTQMSIFFELSRLLLVEASRIETLSSNFCYKLHVQFGELIDFVSVHRIS